MFTGIITDIGRIRSIEPSGDPKIVIETAYDTGTVALGASIACNGVCLTVISKGPETATETAWFEVQVSGETLNLTTAATWRVGTRLNLERALKAGDELGGHIVSGHVDGVGRIVSREPNADSVRFVIEVPPALEKLVARKGSVAVDGISLTVNAVVGRRFGLNIIPHTQHETTLGAAQAGDSVNLEVDMLARYVARLLDQEPS